MPAIQFSHMGVHCFDLAAMKAFYTGVLGLQVTDEGSIERGGETFPLVFLSADPRDHHQMLLTAGRTAGPEAVLLNQIAFRIDSLGTLREMKASLEAAGVEDIKPMDHGNAWSLYFSDPEGNRVETFVDTPWAVGQPRGETLDLSLSDAEIAERTESQIRDEPTFQPVGEWRDEMARKLEAGAAR